MKKITALMMAWVVSILLTACGNDDSTPEALTKYFMEYAKKDNVAMRRKTSPPKETKEDAKTKYVPGFSFRKIGRHHYIISRTMDDHYDDNYESLTFDIGDAIINGSRATVSAYVASNECRFTYSNIEDRWLLSDIVCSEYQY